MSIDLFSILFGVYSVSVPNFILAFSSLVIASIASVCSLSSTCTSYVDDVIFETFLMSSPFISAMSVLLDSFSIFKIAVFVVPSSASINMFTSVISSNSVTVDVLFPTFFSPPAIDIFAFSSSVVTVIFAVSVLFVLV